MKKILIVDDETGIVNFVKIYFEKIGYKVIEANSGKQALKKLSLNPDIILLDIMMPDMDGIQLCKMIRDKVCCPILFLTAKIEEADRVLGLSVGGDDYILKPFSIEELRARVEAHLRREERKKINSTIRFFDKFWVDYSLKQAGYDKSAISLTKKEFEIIELLSLNVGQVFSREQIYEKVWGYDAEGDAEVAITEHIKRIRKKFEVYSSRSVIKTIWGVGYRWEF